MKREELYTGVDIGAQSVRVVVGQRKANDEVDILGVGESRLGAESYQANQEVMVAAVKRAADEARNMASAPIREVTLGVPGTFLKGVNSKGVVRVRNDQITDDDVMRVLEPASAIPLGEGARVLKLFPQDYIVDHRPGVKDPRGLHAVRLDTHVHVIVGNHNQIENLRGAVERTGIAVRDVVPHAVASSEAVLHTGEKELGVLLLDIGTQATEVAVWLNGALHFTTVMGFGGAVLTKDISKGLRLPQVQAEDIKRRYGTAIAGMVEEDELIEIPTVTGESTERRPRKIVAELIEPRLEDVFNEVGHMLKETGLESEIRGGCVLTGGTAELNGIGDLARDVLGLPVRIGKPEPRNHLGGMIEYTRSSSMACAVGLVLYGARGVRGGLYVPTARTGGRLRRFLEKVAASF
jgi:cell division protein FtsA